MELSLIQIIQYALILPVIGAVVVILGLKYKRSFYAGKIKCVFYLKNNEIKETFIRPDEREMLEFRKGLYLYRENFIRLAENTMAGKVPQLTYVENNPIPVSMEGYQKDELNLTARQLKTDFEDNAMRSFAAATDMEATDEMVAKFKTVLLVGLGAVTLFMIIGFYTLLTKLGEINVG